MGEKQLASMQWFILNIAKTNKELAPFNTKQTALHCKLADAERSSCKLWLLNDKTKSQTIPKHFALGRLHNNEGLMGILPVIS